MEHGFGYGVEEGKYGFLTGTKLVPVTIVGVLVKREWRGGVGLVYVDIALHLRASSEDGWARSGVMFGGGVGTEESMVLEVPSIAFYVYFVMGRRVCKK